MNWITELEKVYDKTIDKKSGDKPFPIYHITNNASLTITLDKIGNFITTDLIDKKDKDRITCMPCTESCSSRTSGADAYPLFDKLEYVSGDGEKFEKWVFDEVIPLTMKIFKDCPYFEQGELDYVVSNMKARVENIKHAATKVVYEHIRENCSLEKMYYFVANSWFEWQKKG